MHAIARLRSLLSAYREGHPSERETVLGFERLLDRGGAIFSRSNFNPGHLTASALIVDHEQRRLGLIRHKKIGLWLQPGGHFEVATPDRGGEFEEPIEAALREAREETGLHTLKPWGEALFDIDIHTIAAHANEPAHLHHDLRFVFTSEAGAQIVIEQREVSDFAFVDFDQILDGRFMGETDASVRRAARKLREAFR